VQHAEKIAFPCTTQRTLQNGQTVKPTRWFAYIPKRMVGTLCAHPALFTWKQLNSQHKNIFMFFGFCPFASSAKC
jgi:hypothetical protein